MEQSNIGAGVHKNELERSKMLQKEAYEKCAKFEDLYNEMKSKFKESL